MTAAGNPTPCDRCQWIAAMDKDAGCLEDDLNSPQMSLPAGSIHASQKN
jgi:hypothetical protein